jgi:hypothetical protein
MKALLKSSALRTGAIYGGAGLAFAVANLLLARALPVQEYAFFALGVAFLNIAIPVAPLGLDGMINRHRVAAGPWLMRRAAGTAALTALFAAAMAAGPYDLPLSFVLLIGLAVFFGGPNYVAAAHLQSRQEFLHSLALVQGANVVMLGAAVGALLLNAERAIGPFGVLCGYYLVAALTGWKVIFDRDAERLAPPFRWSESVSYFGVSAVVIVLGQLERLVIPKVLDMEALATFAVLAATVGSVFRILLLGVGYSLLPALRAAPDVPTRRRLVGREARATLALMLVASPAIWWGSIWLVDHLLTGRYVLTPGLVLAAMVTGYIRVGGAFARTIVSALGTARQLAALNLFGWIAIAAAVAAAAVGARWGLRGVIYGVGVGWLIQASTAAYFAVPLLRGDRPEPVGSPPPADLATAKLR